MTFSFPRRAALRRALALIASTSAVPVFAQDSAPVRLVVPFTPGAANDTVGRILAEGMARRQGRTWIVENKPGAGSQIGIDFVAKAAPNGNTLLLGATSGLGVLPAVKADVPYAVERDFSFVGRVASSPYALVASTRLGVADFAAFVQLGKAQPDSIRLGTVGAASLDFMAAALLQSLTGARLRVVPYKGMAQVLNDLRAGHIDAAVVSPATIAPHVAEGHVRALAVLDQRRSALLPNVPSAAEVGQPQLLAGNWWGIVGPAGLPAPVMETLRRDLAALLAVPAFRKTVEDKGFDLAPLVGDGFAQYVVADMQRWKAVARQANIVYSE